jgi:hypothetical protein
LSIGAPAKAVQRYASAASALGSIERLKALHYHAPSGTFRDYGLHTEAVEMVWRDVQVPEGQPPQVRAAGDVSLAAVMVAAVGCGDERVCVEQCSLVTCGVEMVWGMCRCQRASPQKYGLMLGVSFWGAFNQWMFPPLG